ncbi:MAG: TetR/AcrR family transcriptional regulator [Flavobacteriales bacterium]
MDNLFHKFKISVHAATFNKDPETSDLGQAIIKESIDLLDEIGFESFTFKKMAAVLSTSEASIYRYFDNKHKLLTYLVGWYWSWIEYQIAFHTNNLPDAKQKLRIAIGIITSPVSKADEEFTFNVSKLHQIVISESAKTYLCAKVDEENSHGHYKDFKNVVGRISDFILEANPSYQFPHSLISTVIEGSHQQQFFAMHLPSLTDCETNPESIQAFFIDLVDKAIQE